MIHRDNYGIYGARKIHAPCAVPAERDRLAALADGRPDVHWGRLPFSAKESVYKARFPPDRDVARLRGGGYRAPPGS